MSIRLISDTERLACHIDGATIWYRRVPSYVQQRIEAMHNRRGVTDTRAVVEDVLGWAVLGWDNVLDAEGQPVPFNTELLKHLPESAKADLIGKLYESSPEALLGNSNGSLRPVQP